MDRTNDLIFTGDRKKDGMAAEDFLKAMRRYQRVRSVANDADKLADVADRFAHNSPAEQWWKALDASKKATWASFETEFETRFKTVLALVKPRAQLLAELTGMRITLDELAVDHVMVQAEKIAPMTEFVARVRDAVSAVNAGGSGEGVWAFHRALPVGIRSVIGDAPATWDLLLTSMESVLATAIEAAVEDHKRQRAIDNTVEQLTRRINNVRVSPVVQTAPVAAQQPAVNPTAVVRPPAPVNGGGGVAEGGGANGARRTQTRAIPPGTDAQKARLRQIMLETNARQPPDTPDGHAQYAAQIVSWNALNGHIPQESLSHHAWNLDPVQRGMLEMWGVHQPRPPERPVPPPTRPGPRAPISCDLRTMVRAAEYASAGFELR
jgi:hypothetical protein